GKAVGGIREGSRHLAAEVLAWLQTLPGLLTICRRRCIGHEEAVRLLLDDHHTSIRAQWVVASHVTFRRRSQANRSTLWRICWEGETPLLACGQSLRWFWSFK